MVLVPLMPLAKFDQLLVARVALRLGVLLYACEFVLARSTGSRMMLNLAGLASLGALAA